MVVAKKSGTKTSGAKKSGTKVSGPRRYWVMKSEPDVFSFDDLVNDPKGYEHWDGVRNYQARNFLCAQSVGDPVLFYHSNTAIPGVVGIANVVRTAYPDHTAFDPTSKYFDARSKSDKPTWFMSDIAAVRPLKRVISLHEMQTLPELEGLALIARGNRLSVMELTKDHYDAIVARERVAPPAH